MANEASTSSTFMSEVKFTDTEMIYHLSTTVSCARRENDRIILLNTALENEVKELKLVHVNQDELTKKIAFLENRVKYYIQLETILKDHISELKVKANAYYNSCKTAKEIFNKQVIGQFVGIGYDYNESIGELSINTPNRVSAEERGIPDVLKGIDKPFFRESQGEPLNEYSIIIKEEIRLEDLALDLDQSNKCVSDKPVKVVSATETKSNIHKVDQNNCKRFAKLMQSNFEMSMMGELKFFLGLQVSQRSNGIFICQSKYLKELLKKYHMEDSASARTPSSTAVKLGACDNSIKVDVTSYRGMIGSLLYLTASRPDIMYATCLCARFQADPRDLHLVAVKRILRYLKGIPNLGIWYPKDSGFNLIGYTDSDYAGSVVDRKSTYGSCQFLEGRLIFWYNKKQQTVSNSTAEAEYIAVGSCCVQILWIRNQLKDYCFVLDKIPILCDNTSTITISNNPVQHSRTKHIDIRYHFIRENVMNGVVELHFVPTEEQTADIFTKSLDESTFIKLVGKLGMLNSLSD
ncbi:hypothetical protein POM88_015632 [Heracleum sosnowskyi]|uniref:Reverse transcriptase Ty1/copia-type domain-containing protein n=1 Tax=Heracleum sosnowskyi TaxID=360622 RepID=A0AAD8MWE0_9APIA|nr:hypothetical protein POM88_015632 [Heracleum sosnowskyi]